MIHSNMSPLVLNKPVKYKLFLVDIKGFYAKLWSRTLSITSYSSDYVAISDNDITRQINWYHGPFWDSISTLLSLKDQTDKIVGPRRFCVACPIHLYAVSIQMCVSNFVSVTF